MGDPPPRLASRFASFAELGAIARRFVETQGQELVGGAWPLDGAWAASRAREFFEAPGAAEQPAPERFAPFVQRLEVPADAQVAVFGDLHGSYHSLLRSLRALMDKGFLDERLRIPAPVASSFFMLFLGDYVDRGFYGVEVLATLMELKLANPENVFLIRGNHEDSTMNADGFFEEELRAKFPEASSAELRSVFRVYETLPAAIFLGVLPANDTAGVDVSGDFLLCCHGGIEVGFEAAPLLRAPVLGSGRLRISGAALSSALMHGVFRGGWLQSLRRTGGALFGKVERVVNAAELFYDVGTCPLRRLRGGAAAVAATPSAVTTDPDDLAHEVVESPGWNGLGWPQLPTEMLPLHNGFMWSDFLVGDETSDPRVSAAAGGRAAAAGRSLHFSRNRGLALGRELTAHWLGASGGVVGVLRAHQHNDAPDTGPMLQSLKDSLPPGAFDNFGRAGLVLTFLSGAFIPGQGFEFDAFGLLRLPARASGTWAVEGCANKVAPHHRSGAGGVSGARCSLAALPFRCLSIPWAAGSNLPRIEDFHFCESPERGSVFLQQEL